MAFGHFLRGLSQCHGHGSWLVCEVALNDLQSAVDPWLLPYTLDPIAPGFRSTAQIQYFTSTLHASRLGGTNIA